MARRRNADEPWRALWRQAGTGDLDAARRLVRALERAGHHGQDLLSKPIDPKRVGDDRKARVLVGVSIDEIPNLRDMLLERTLGSLGGNLANYRVVDMTEDGQVVLEVDLEDIELPEQIDGKVCVRCGAPSVCTCANLPSDRDWTCPQHGLETDFDRDDPEAVLDPLCAVCDAEIDDCDDWCATEHDEGCDGYCTHGRASHMNECIEGEARRLARIMRERRESR